jgi:hypothetical protein
VGRSLKLGKVGADMVDVETVRWRCVANGRSKFRGFVKVFEVEGDVTFTEDLL